MADRKLRSHTIIPSELYLRRRADDQLREIIDDMGRPGYVLVARQMGKTNLLLNAKRELPGPEDLFVYLDVSNLFPEVRSFFRNLIDVTLEALLPDGLFLQSAIQQSRTESASLPPHKEHEIELRRLLQTVKGKVVVCLDEIDALTKTAYSDQVFSFIRTVYFAGRSNFEEFTRLTYVLSGVAEPGDLIQNRAVSPFNIGEKIYLDDFTYEEFCGFLLKADLGYSKEVADRIFYWVEGHPRMTWDFCAALERRSGNELGIADVDEEVRELYFGSVNVPPIDHIKDLAAHSKDMRDSVMAIHYQKTEALTDSARTRLYLAGVSRFDTHKRVAAFKNRVIERALSEDFIRSIDSVDTVQIEAGMKLFEVGQFADALALFSSITRGTNDPRLKSTATHWAALSQFQLGKFSDAIRLFQSVEEIEESVKIVHWYFRGLSHLNLGEKDEAVSWLKMAIDTEKKDIYYYSAKANLGTALSMSDRPNSTSLAEAVQLSQELLDDAGAIRAFNNGSGNSVLVAAYCTMSKAARLRSDIEAARQFITLAKEYASSTELLNLAMMDVSLTDRSTLQAYVTIAVEAVLSIKTFSLSSLDHQNALKEVGRLLELLEAAGRRDEAGSIVDHVLDHVAPSEQLLEVIEQLVFSTFTKGLQNLGAALVQKMLEREQIKRIPSAYKSILTFASIMDDQIALKYGNSYVQICTTTRDREDAETNTTIRALYAVYAAAIRNSDFDLAGGVSLLVGDLLKSNEFSSSSNPSALLLRDYMSTLLALKMEGNDLTAANAGALIRKLYSLRQFDLPLFAKEFHRSMMNDLAQGIRAVATTNIVKREKKYGRNSWVVVSFNGEERIGKYKKFAEDVEAGRCVVLREQESNG